MPAQSPAARAARKEAVKRRIRSSCDSCFRSCLIWDERGPCGRPTEKFSLVGFSKTMCARHARHSTLHGAATVKSPRASQLAPYLRASLTLITRRGGEAFVLAALTGIRTLVENAGEPELTTRLRGRSAKEKAQQCLARLRQAGVSESRLLAIPLSIAAFADDAPAMATRKKQWIWIATGKAAHRLSKPGFHKTWEFRDDSGRIHRTELHYQARAGGRMLAYLGAALWHHAEWLIEKHVEEIVKLKGTQCAPLR